ncbi:glucose-6-phosphate isomerase [Candidatus Margulisiibacteriota bacterium]
MPNFKETKAYKKLLKNKKELDKTSLFKMFALDTERAEKFIVSTDYLYYDYSRQLINDDTLKLLKELAEETGLKDKIKNMFSGKKINTTEKRAVLHVALRNLKDGRLQEVQAELDHINKFSSDILLGKLDGATGKKIKNIVSIGIGGSYLGPEYLAVALKPFIQKGMRLIFVANVDGTDFVEKTAGLNPEETLIIIVSKTFTTAETMKNAESAKKWMLAGLNNHAKAIEDHFVAVSTSKDKVIEFGIDEKNIFGFWDWVGGRYSATSAVGILPLSLYLGFENARKILEGAHWMDQHFLTEPVEKNIPILSGLLDIWNINYLGLKTRALLPYSQGLAKLPAHTQQVEMESNGKCVTLDGGVVDYSTGEVVFGEPGTNGQHSFYQEIHQGQVIPCDFIGFLKPQYRLGEANEKSVTHHQELMTNFLAQPDALAFGKEDDNSHKHFPGNRPSSSLLLRELTPFTAGLLLAWTEHRAAVKGFVWGINSFDQFGVELGKVLGKEHRRKMLDYNTSEQIDTEGLNKSTAKLLASILTEELPD